MATKEFKGPVDCLGAALPDEEYFMLLARDPLMPGLTMIWASLRLGDIESALANFRALCAPQLVAHYVRNPDTAKSEEAVEVAQRGQAWRERNVAAGEDGKPSWKASRAVGMERFVVEYAERRPEDQGGVTVIRQSFEEFPFWLRPIYDPPQSRREVETTFERVPPAETEGDCA